MALRNNFLYGAWAAFNIDLQWNILFKYSHWLCWVTSIVNVDCCTTVVSITKQNTLTKTPKSMFNCLEKCTSAQRTVIHAIH